MLLLTKSHPSESIWFCLMASYSMIPLYIKDSNFLMGVIYTMTFFVVLTPQKSMEITSSRLVNRAITISLLAGVGGSVLYYAFPPPMRYPDLHSVIISSISCGYFVLEYLAVLRRQFYGHYK